MFGIFEVDTECIVKSVSQQGKIDSVFFDHFQSFRFVPYKHRVYVEYMYVNKY